MTAPSYRVTINVNGSGLPGFGSPEQVAYHIKEQVLRHVDVYPSSVRVECTKQQSMQDAQRRGLSVTDSLEARDLLVAIVQEANPQSGPGPDDRDVNRERLNELCREAEQFLYKCWGVRS